MAITGSAAVVETVHISEVLCKYTLRMKTRMTLAFAVMVDLAITSILPDISNINHSISLCVVIV